MRAKNPRFYFNLRSPYSWLAHHDLEQRYPDVADAVQWRPFWEPDELSGAELAQAGGRFLYTTMTKEKHLYILSDVRRLATDRGLQVRWPIDREPRWETAHLPFFLCPDAAAGRRYVRLVARARWEQGRDICDPDVIADIAGEVGIDAEHARHADQDPTVRAQATAALCELDRDGVFGVPFLVHGRDKFWGVDRVAGFAAAVRHELSATAATAATAKAHDMQTNDAAVLVPAMDATPRFDDGHAGGCG